MLEGVDGDTGFAIRLALTLLAGAIGLFLYTRQRQPTQSSGGDGKKSRDGRGKRRGKQAADKDSDESDFSDEPDRPLQDSDDEDPGAALERLPRVKLEHEIIESDEMCRRARQFYENMNRRRTVRTFSRRPVPLEVIENIVRVGGTAPSGAHTEPWTYVVVSDPDLKAQIRQVVEREEEVNYDRRMGTVWVKDLTVLGTDFSKPYLEDAPYLIVAFEQTSGIRANGKKKHHYYSRLSASISTGMLLTAIHNAGLVTVTSTPLNAYAALRDLLDRPDTEKAFLLLPIGYPAEDTTVPDLVRKPLSDIMVLK